MGDIKSFLKETKHARNACIDDYFPDVEQFITNTRSFMSEGYFHSTGDLPLEENSKLNVLLNSSVYRV